MLLSQRCEYALRTAIYVATLGRASYVSTREVSAALGIPRHYLAKTVRSLTASGLFVSRREPNGGIALARPPDGITLKEVVLAVDGSAVFTECVLGLSGCGEEKPCPLHEEWGPTRDRIECMFEADTLATAATRL